MANNEIETLRRMIAIITKSLIIATKCKFTWPEEMPHTNVECRYTWRDVIENIRCRSFIAAILNNTSLFM